MWGAGLSTIPPQLWPESQRGRGGKLPPRLCPREEGASRAAGGPVGLTEFYKPEEGKLVLGPSGAQSRQQGLGVGRPQELRSLGSWAPAPTTYQLRKRQILTCHGRMGLQQDIPWCPRREGHLIGHCGSFSMSPSLSPPCRSQQEVLVDMPGLGDRAHLHTASADERARKGRGQGFPGQWHPYGRASPRTGGPQSRT